ncbi:MAG: Glu-tRNA(Gln) amidotransferase subunit GatD [Thaumarchaeota archaeon]|nr:Glu-tRNA(Gln) amidotransferase subunit GatD [Nitrososphaerota archaeon]
MSGGDGGYGGESLAFLESVGARVGDSLEGGGLSGRVMPRYEGGEDGIVVLKLASGYNVAVRVGRLAGSRVAGAPARAAAPAAPARPAPAQGLPSILLLSTGGTIASRIDYVTGAVTPALDAAGLAESVPELAGIARIEPRVAMSEHSENIEPSHWELIATAVRDGSAGHGGVIVAHGTDTMQHTASYLAFALAGLPVPVVLVGAQRSPDRPSSDAAENLAAAARLIASSPGPGVLVAMHEGSSDGRVSCHRATRVRKRHTSARGAFETVGGPPAFTVTRGGIEGPSGRRAGTPGTREPRIGVDARAALLKYHPGMDASAIDGLVERGCRALVLEGTGLGHVGRALYAPISRAVEAGALVMMCSQCGDGEVNMNVYESGRELQKLGVVPLRDMLSETALVKAMWALSQEATREGLERLMLENVASEMSP